MKVLVVEDEKRLAAFLEKGLRAIDSPDDLRDAVSGMKPGDDVALWVQRGKVSFFAAIELAA